MYEGIFLISVLAILYGVIRFCFAKWRREDNPIVHILWIPASAFFFAVTVSICAWIY